MRSVLRSKQIGPVDLFEGRATGVLMEGNGLSQPGSLLSLLAFFVQNDSKDRFVDLDPQGERESIAI